MRLHRLEVSAFGPYAEAATVDFDALAADGLFLLYGQTGAGKTTILDAIAYALFGRVPGARQQAGRLRCDYAAPETAPEVALELTLGQRRLRVVRSPEWQRPKRRGTGTTRENARATLSEHGAEGWRVISTRIDEVSEQLHQWLGMSAEQFFQVVLLPQGEFARFLRAESTEREELLERLFGTRRFGDVEGWLSARRRAAREGVAAAEGRIRGLLARLCQAAGVDDRDLADADDEWIHELVHSAAARVAEAVAAEDVAARALTLAAAEHDAVVSLRRRQERRLAAEEERAKVEAASDEQDARRDEVAHARRASVVMPLLRGANAAADLVVRCAERTATALARLRAVMSPGMDVPAEPSALPGWAEQLRADTVRLDALRREEESLPLAEAAVVALDVRLRDLAAEAAGQEAAAAVLPARIEEARAALARSERATERLSGLATERERLDAALDAAREHRVVAGGLGVLRANAVAAADVQQAARERVLDLRERRLDGYAAELAEALVAGAPCAVCGGLEHPSPAQPTAGERVTQEAETSAREAEERARAARELAEQAVTVAEGELVRLAAVAGGRGITELEAAAGELAAETQRIGAEAARVGTVRLLLADLERQLSDSVAAGRELSTRLAEVGAERSQRVSALDALRRRLDDARQEDASVAARAARLGQLADAVNAVVEAHRDEAAARAALADAQRAAEGEAVRAGFDGTESAAAAWLDDAALSALEAECRHWSDRDAATASILADPELAGLGELTAHTLVDVTGAASALDVARAAHGTAAASASYAEHQDRQVREAAKAVSAALAEAAPAREECDRIAALADVVSGQGQNTRRMTLRAYVLAARLDEVGRCASQRLRRMSSGRYTFVFTGDADSRRVRAGLNLHILDDFSGQARSTRTLSGGESFMASLALALGLADVVAAESGGTQLETLFIDEGFGSLDADTLDLVMDTLDDLRAGGRVIGVVSHVAEMRQRIPMRLRVRKAGVTSRLELEAG